MRNRCAANFPDSTRAFRFSPARTNVRCSGNHIGIERTRFYIKRITRSMYSDHRKLSSIKFGASRNRREKRGTSPGLRDVLLRKFGFLRRSSVIRKKKSGTRNISCSGETKFQRLRKVGMVNGELGRKNSKASGF